MRRPWSVVVSVLVPLAVLASACSDDGSEASGSTEAAQGTVASTLDLTGECETGSWVSTDVTFPAQAAIPEITPTGGGDGMDIEFGADGAFQIDFGPMSEASSTFDSGGAQGLMSLRFSGVGKGVWTVDADGLAMASFDDFTTAKALVTMTLGETVPPIMDTTFQEINDNRMIGGGRVGVFTVTGCTADSLTMTTPFPGGDVTITAAKA